MINIKAEEEKEEGGRKQQQQLSCVRKLHSRGRNALSRSEDSTGRDESEMD